MSLALSFLSKNKPRISRALLRRMKDAVLGKHYILSVVFTNLAQMRRLNRAYRGKNEPTDILSFPLSKTEGEVFIAPSVARREAKKFGMPFEDLLRFLVIHGLLHLKGMKHGSRMEKLEAKFGKQFGI
jgi:probable rRNA maturation factor